jgi:hypothetical protein
MKEKNGNIRAICAGCKYFRVNPGPYRYTCLLWGVKSVNYNVAQVVFLSTGQKCPYCSNKKEKEKEKKELIQSLHDGEIDIVI